VPETLYLIDGFAQIFRAYYAIRGGMRSPVTGEPTHAVFGVTGMLLKLLSQFQPHYVAVAIDTPAKTFRDDLYASYKGTRQATPDDLQSQIPRVLEMIEHFGVPLIGCPGLEADDIIATIVERLLADPAYAGVNVRIVSKDKDLEQLLCDRVSMFDIHTDTTIDVAALLANKGITPEQVVDVLTLTGDTVDNVPGVAGIGIKTAAQLVQQFGSIEGILANLDKLSPKRRESIEKAQAHLPLSRILVTLKRDGDVPFSLEAARVRPPDPDRLVPLFQELGFNRFQDEVRKLAVSPVAVGSGSGVSVAGEGSSDVVLDATSAPGHPAMQWDGGNVARGEAGSSYPSPRPPAKVGLPEGESVGQVPETAAEGAYHAVMTRVALDELVTTLRAQPMIAVDTETTGLSADAKLCGLSFSWAPGQGVYVPVRSPAPETHLDEATVLAALRPVLEDASLPKCGHNLKFDARVLLRSGVCLRGIAFDSLLASMLIDPAQPAHKLDHLALVHLNYLMIPITDLIGTGAEQGTVDTVPLEKVTTYAAEDADIALRLYRFLDATLQAMGLSGLLREVEAPLSAVLAVMEENGVICDPDELSRQGEILRARVDELRLAVFAAAGCEFHLDSTKQLAEVLYDKLGLAPGKKTKTGRSTDIEELERLTAREDRNDPRTSVPRLIIEYRQLQKLISTYLGTLRQAVDARTGRIHTTFHQLVTATGRLASQGPNLQNIPVRTDIGRQVRKAFLAPPGHRLICADYSQIELRLLAHLSEDRALIEAFEQDQDIHAAVASHVFGVALEEVTREQRNHAKTINFGIIYGVTPFGLSRRIEGLDLARATQLIADYKQRFPGIDIFLQRCIQQALEAGYVSTILGRRRAIPEIQATSFNKRSLGERLAINTVVQGSAADLIKLAMVNVQRRLDRDRLPLRMLLQIHDELVFETPTAGAEEHAAIVREEMERAMTLRVPLKAETGIGADWMSAK
jgi:DNA polymerase I